MFLIKWKVSVSACCRLYASLTHSLFMRLRIKFSALADPVTGMLDSIPMSATHLLFIFRFCFGPVSALVLWSVHFPRLCAHAPRFYLFTLFTPYASLGLPVYWSPDFSFALVISSHLFCFFLACLTLTCFSVYDLWIILCADLCYGLWLPFLNF